MNVLQVVIKCYNYVGIALERINIYSFSEIKRNTIDYKMVLLCVKQSIAKMNFKMNF